MTDRPILFSAAMVKALLAGRKTQTRRILKLPTKGIYENPKMGGWAPTTSGGGGCFTITKNGTRVPAEEQVAIWHQTTGLCIEMRWQPGDRLWVKETWRTHRDHDPIAPNSIFDGTRCVLVSYTVDADNKDWLGRSRSSIHMPRIASRLTLIVTDVRVQRLQDISDEDTKAEGFDVPCRECFAQLWVHLHGTGAWDSNPFVVALTFSVHRDNIDALAARVPASPLTCEDAR